MILSFDIGGTKISSGLVSKSFPVSDFKTIGTPKNKENFLNAIFSAIKGCEKNHQISTIGIGCAGLIDKSGTIVKSPNLDFLSGVNLKEIVEKKFPDISVKIANDAQCFTLAEAMIGAGKNYSIVIGLTIGTGLGGGIAIDKKNFEGRSGFAGEFGHAVINANYPEKCRCGNCGCLEQFVSGKALERYYFEITKNKKTSEEIGNLSASGNLKAGQAVQKLSEYLGIGLANIAHILNPDAIIIGGSLGKIGSLFEPAAKSTHSRLLSPKLEAEILSSELKDSAVLIGAAML